MSDEELAGAADQLPATENEVAHDARQVVQEIIRREQRRVWLLAGLSVFFWLLAVAGLILLLVGLNRFVIYIRVSNHLGAGGAQPGDTSSGSVSIPAIHEMLWGTNLLHHSIPLVGGSLLALLLAALCTVVLAFSSRRATLQQIQLSLMLLSDQLKELRQIPASGPLEDAETRGNAPPKTATFR
jgi:hypothetical protein